jgi:hypothetical protein
VDSEAVQETETAGMMADTTKVQEEETVVVAVAEEETSDRTAAQERCTRQPAQTADRRQKYHLSQQRTDLFTAGNASRSTDLRDIKILIRNKDPGR